MEGTAKRAGRAVRNTAQMVGRAVRNYSHPGEGESLGTTAQLSSKYEGEGDDDESKLGKYEGDDDDESQLRTGDDDGTKIRTNSVSEGSRRRLGRERQQKGYLTVVNVISIVAFGILLFAAFFSLGWGLDRKLFPDQKVSMLPGSGVQGTAGEKASIDKRCDERRLSQEDLSNMHGSAEKKEGETRTRGRLAATKGDAGRKTYWDRSKGSEKSRTGGLFNRRKLTGLKSEGSRRRIKVRISQDVVPSVEKKNHHQLIFQICSVLTGRGAAA